jgi:Zn-dependent oligopeptidase
LLLYYTSSELLKKEMSTMLSQMAQCTRQSLYYKKLVFNPISPTTNYRCFRICTMHHGLPGKQRYSATKHTHSNNHYNYSPSVRYFSTSSNDSSRGKETSDISQDATSKSTSIIREGFHQLWKNLVYRIRRMTRRSNPILDDISDITMGIKNRPIFYPRIHDIQPHHFSDAFEEILSQTQTLHQEMEDTFRGILIKESTGDEKQLLIDNTHIHGLPLEDSVLQNLYRIYFPTYYLRNLLGLYLQVNQITILRRDRTVFQNLLLVQSKLAYYNATLTPTNPSLLYLTMEHIREKQSQLLTRDSSLQRQKEYDELEKKRRALELILERESTICCADDNAEQHPGISEQSRQLQEKNDDEIDELHIFQTLKKLSFQIKRRQQQQGSQQQEQQKYYASALTHIYQLLSSRKRKANILGYESYAQLFLSKNMMIKNCENITTIHSSIAERAIPVVLQSQVRWIHEEEQEGKRPNQRVTNVAGYGSFSTSTFQKPAVWDKLSAYLELQTVLKGMFDLTRRLFGIIIKEDTTDKSHQIWDRDVRIFHLYDEDDEMKYLASFYLDPYQRPDSKVLGDNMCISLVDRAIHSHTKTIIAATDPSSSNTTSSSTTATIRTSPLVCIICDIHPADWNDSPCLLSFEDATNLFHEFGHALHQMLTAVDVGFVAGTNGVELDAVEFPSQVRRDLYLYSAVTI